MHPSHTIAPENGRSGLTSSLRSFSSTTPDAFHPQLLCGCFPEAVGHYAQLFIIHSLAVSQICSGNHFPSRSLLFKMLNKEIYLIGAVFRTDATDVLA